MKRRIISLLICLSFVLSSCGGSTDNEMPDDGTISKDQNATEDTAPSLDEASEVISEPEHSEAPATEEAPPAEEIPVEEVPPIIELPIEEEPPAIPIEEEPPAEPVILEVEYPIEPIIEVEEPAAVAEKAYQLDERCLKKYEGILRETIKSNNGLKTYALAYFDDDDIPELVIGEATYGARPGNFGFYITIYSYNSDKDEIIEHSEFNDAGLYMYYNEGEGRFMFADCDDTYGIRGDRYESNTLNKYSFGENIKKTNNCSITWLAGSHEMVMNYRINDRQWSDSDYDFISREQFWRVLETEIGSLPDKELVLHQINEESIKKFYDTAAEYAKNAPSDFNIREFFTLTDEHQKEYDEFMGLRPVIPEIREDVSVYTVLDAYQAFLDTTAESFSPSAWRYSLAYIDGDRIPELLIAQLTDNEVQIYRYDENGKVAFVSLMGNDGRLEYQEYANNIYLKEAGTRRTLLPSRLKYDDAAVLDEWVNVEGFYDMNRYNKYTIAYKESGDRFDVCQSPSDMADGDLFSHPIEELLQYRSKFENIKRNFKNFDVLDKKCSYSYTAIKVKDIYRYSDMSRQSAVIPDGYAQDVQDVLNKYYEYLLDYITTKACYGFTAADIDNCGTPELLIRDSSAVSVYHMNNGNVELYFVSEFHTMFTNMFYSSTGDEISVYSVSHGVSSRSTQSLTAEYYRKTDGGIAKERTLEYVFQPFSELPEGAQSMSEAIRIGYKETFYYGNDAKTEVTESEFTEYLGKCPPLDREVVFYDDTEENFARLKDGSILKPAYVTVGGDFSSVLFSSYGYTIPFTE